MEVDKENSRATRTRSSKRGLAKRAPLRRADSSDSVSSACEPFTIATDDAVVANPVPCDVASFDAVRAKLKTAVKADPTSGEAWQPFLAHELACVP